MKRSRPFNILLAIIGGVLLLFALGFGGLVAWVVTGPRSLDALTPYIESSLFPPGSPYRVKIGSSLLLWDGMTHPVGIHVKDVDIEDGKGVSLAHFPEVALRVYFFKLLVGNVDIKSIELLRPVTTLAEDEKGDIKSFGFSTGGDGANTSIASALEVFTGEGGEGPLAHLNSFIVRDASLSIKDSHGNTFLSSPEASIEITRKHSIAKGKLRMPLKFDGKSGDIDITSTLDGKAQTVESSIVFSDIPSGVLHALAPAQQWMDGVHMPLSGWANLKSDFDANISSIDFTLDTGDGEIDFPDQFEKPLKLKHIKFSGTLTDKLTVLNVKEGLLDFGQPTLRFSGTVHRQGDDIGVDGNVEIADILIDELHHYWPLTLAPHSRNWVVTRLKGGKITKATGALHFAPGDFKLKDTPEKDVDATIAVKGTTITYKPGNPPITNAEGTVRFTGRSMDAEISSATYLSNTHVTAMRARFPDFYPDDVQMLIDMNIETTAKDVQRFLSLPDLNKAAALNLTPDITGEAKGKGKLDFIAFSENDKDDVSATGKINYSVEGDLTHVTQKHFMGNRDVADANMKILLDNKGIKAVGTAKVNELPMHVDLTNSFAHGHDTTYGVETDMPVARLPDFGLPKLNWAAGTIGVDATFFSSDTADKATAMLDLTATSIKLPEHGFNKNAGTKASLELSTETLPTGNTLISNFTLKEGEQMASGSAEFDKPSQDFQRFSFAPLRIGQHDLETLSYEKEGNTVKLSAKGKSFDATPYLKPDDKKSDLSYVIDLRTDRLILGEKREMREVSVQADCPADACRSAQIRAKLIDGSPFVYNIGAGKLQGSCENTGELARTLAIYDTIEGGKMSIAGEYKDGKIEGTLIVNNYSLKHAPVMTKIFTVASLTGFLDTLSGKGIYFDKLTAPFIYHDGLIMLKDARAHGSALGFTADGMIDTNKNTLNLKGMLVPSYTLNSLVGKIPLLGSFLSGGPGSGLLALSYGVHGDMKDPSVRVNPLSVLTPGALRDVFTIFDKPAPDIDAIEKEQQKQIPADNIKGLDAVPAPAAPKQVSTPAFQMPANNPSATPMPSSAGELKK